MMNTLDDTAGKLIDNGKVMIDNALLALLLDVGKSESSEDIGIYIYTDTLSMYYSEGRLPLVTWLDKNVVHISLQA